LPPNPNHPRGHFTERAAANLSRALISFVAFAHSKGVMHRDLKPENIMMSSRRSEEAVLKVVDYGTSEFVWPGRQLTAKFGVRAGGVRVAGGGCVIG